MYTKLITPAKIKEEEEACTKVQVFILFIHFFLTNFTFPNICYIIYKNKKEEREGWLIIMRIMK